jgi:hypothetical protein
VSTAWQYSISICTFHYCASSFKKLFFQKKARKIEMSYSRKVNLKRTKTKEILKNA